MAIKFSEKQVNLARKKYYGKFYFNHDLNFFKVIINKILIYIFKIKILVKNFKRKIFSIFIKVFKKRSEKFDQIDFKLNLKQSDLDQYSSKLEKNNFIFIENFFEDRSYKQILKYWPNINFFSQSSNILKSYSTGFSDMSDKKFNYFIGVKDLFKFIKSSEFEKSINELLKFEKKKYFNYSIGLSMVGNNSYLAPHIDGVQTEKSKTYNFIFFIDGNNSNPSLSGGTGLYSDNNFEKPIFIPTTLKNSVLIYNSTSEFYHGFNFTILDKKTFRKTINFQFFPKDL